jgi:hypothetical protein
MLYLDGFVGLVLLALWLFCIIDVVLTREDRMRNLPKVAWVLIVIFLPTLGSLLWLVLGRPWEPGRPNRNIPPTNGFPEYERLGRATGTSSASDAEFLRQCRERAEAQRIRYQQQRQRETGED